MSGLSQAEAKSLKLYPALPCRWQVLLSHHLLPHRYISWRLNEKQSTQDLKQHFYMGCWHPKWQYNPLYRAIASASGEFLKEHPEYLIVFLSWASTEKEIVYFPPCYDMEFSCALRVVDSSTLYTTHDGKHNLTAN